MFDKRIKDLRIEKNITQKQLANALNVDESTVRKWEIGKSETSFSMLIKLADFFDVSIDYLLGRKDY